MQNTEEIKNVSRSKKVLITVITLFSVYTVVGFLITPLILRSILTKKLTEQLVREVFIEDIDMNPYALSIRVEGLRINEPDDPDVFVSFDELYVNLEIISVVKRGIIVKECRIDSPYLHVVHHERGRFNFSDLVSEKRTEGEAEPTGAPCGFL